MNERAYDLLIVGGGINGAGIARDAAGNSLSVLLVEQRDFAAATSSASSKLIHGGLRYLEHGALRLVRESLAEREVVLRLAPHLVRPLRFVLPHEPAMRPAWMLRLALWTYDHLGERRMLPPSGRIDLARAVEGAPLAPQFRRGFTYWDCWCNDSRLVIANLLDAAERGAVVRSNTALVSARRAGAVWHAELAGAAGRETVRARALINAAGPWASRVMDTIEGAAGGKKLKLIKGSHIVVDRVHGGDHAYIFQHTDRRIFFLLPFQEKFSLIGTTETPFEGELAAAAIDAAETDYLLAALNRVLCFNVPRSAIRWAFSGVRPLYDDGSVDASATTRDYVFDLDVPRDGPPLLTVFGGKLTTFRRLAEHALEKLMPALGRAGRRWTAKTPLPGGDMTGADFAAFTARFVVEHSFLPTDLARRYARLYGTRAHVLLEDVRREADLGAPFGAGLYEREVDYLRRVEWAATAEDILWRRTKLGLFMSPDGVQKLAQHMGK